MQRALKNLLFSLLTAALLLGGAELGLRIAGWPDPGIYAGDIASVWWLRADLDQDLPFPEQGTSFHVRTGSMGFRGEDPPPAAIACVGDSTTFGWGVREDEAWPARLQELLGEPVLNAATPGYSSRQALATVDRLLQARPSTVLLALLVRDAQLAPRPDHLSRPAPAPGLRLMAALGVLLQRKAAPPPATVPRVDAEHFEQNLRDLKQRLSAEGVEVRFVAFPMVEPALDHLEVLDRFDALRVDLPREAFFEQDPIHLTAEGHQAMAEQIAAWW